VQKYNFFFNWQVFFNFFSKIFKTHFPVFSLKLIRLNSLKNSHLAEGKDTVFILYNPNIFSSFFQNIFLVFHSF